MANKDKGLNRGGTQGQQGDLPSGGQDQGWHSPTGLGERNKQKQQGGMNREPDLEKKKEQQPTHVVD